MAAPPSLGRLLGAAFHARPAGMFVPPNWIGIAAFGLLGFVNPGLWIVGAGLEAAYLYALITNTRFRRFVASRGDVDARRVWEERRDELVEQLERDDRARYEELAHRCAAIVEQQTVVAGAAAGVAAQGEGLARLLWIYLRLLHTRRAVQRLLLESYATENEGQRMAERLASLERRISEEQMSDQLRNSLVGQADILRQRLEKRQEATQKLDFLDAELTRLQEQVELVREQAALTTDPELVSQRIDAIAANLGGTNRWISEQQRFLGTMEDLLTDPPPVVAPGAKESA